MHIIEMDPFRWETYTHIEELGLLKDVPKHPYDEGPLRPLHCTSNDAHPIFDSPPEPVFGVPDPQQQAGGTTLLPVLGCFCHPDVVLPVRAIRIGLPRTHSVL